MRRLLLCIWTLVGAAAIAAIAPSLAVAAEPPVSFGAPATATVPSSADSLSGTLATADFNRDGHADVAAFAANYQTEARSLAVWMSSVSGSSTSWSWTTLTPPSVAHFESGQVATAEMNPGTDSDPDLVALSISGASGDSALGVYLGNGNGTFGAPVETSLPGYANGLAVGDVNGDGIPDVLIPTLVETAGGWEAEVVTLIGLGEGRFETPIVSPIDSSEESEPYGVFATDIVVGDFTGSGYPAIAVSQAFSPAKDVYVMSGDGTGHFTVANSLALGAGSFGLASGDFDGDGHDDLALPIGDLKPGGEGRVMDERIATGLGHGDGTFTALTPETPRWEAENPYSYTIASADLNGDGLPDLLLPMASDYDEGGVWALLSDGDGAFSPAAESDLESDNVWDVTSGDFDGDGHPDVVALVQANGDTTLELAVYDNTSEPSLQFGSSALEIGAAQVGQTGIAPLAITNGGNYALSISALSVAGADAADFHVTGCASAPIAPGATCDAQVSFSPSRVGAEGATLTVGSDDPVQPTTTVALSGSGTAASAGTGSQTASTSTTITKGASGKGMSTGPVGKLTPAKTAAVSRSGKAALKLSCTGGPCTGKLALTASVKKKSKGKSKTVTLIFGQAKYSLAAGKSETIAIKLSAAALKQLAAVTGHKLSAKLIVTPATGTKSTAKLTLRG